MYKNDDSVKDILKYVGGMIRERRRELGISQEKLAEHANLHTTTISDIERGKSNLTLKSLESIAGVLKCSESFLLPVEDFSNHKELYSVALKLMATYDECNAQDKKRLIMMLQSLIRIYS